MPREPTLPDPDSAGAIHAIGEIAMDTDPARYKDGEEDNWTRLDGLRGVQVAGDVVLVCIECDQTHEPEASG